PTQDLLALARESVRSKLRAALHKALRHGAPEIVTTAKIKRDQKYFPVRISVRPLRNPKSADGLLLVTFADQAEEVRRRMESNEPAEDESALRHLEYELKVTREDLQSTIEEMESSNEELKASNEEVMSMNEELQSANEELETSKEEL